MIAYMLNNLDPAARRAYMPDYFKCLVTASVLNRGTISEATNWQSCAIVMPPGSDIGNPWTLVPAGLLGVMWTLGLGGARKALVEYSGAAAAAKKKGMGKGERYYYLFFIGTLEEGRGKGLGSALIRECQEVASKDGAAVWLEATTEDSMRLYTRLGFKLVEEMIMGKGQAGPDGEFKKGGEGVRCWAMVWRPENTKSIP